MKYDSANEAKATFDDVYHAATPHAYFGEMDRHQYEIGEEAKPYFRAAIEHLEAANQGHLPPRMLDLGCSYGVGSALVKYDCTYRELSAFFHNEAPQEYDACVEATRDWLQPRDAHGDLECVGLDCSGEALSFAEDAGLLCSGIASNFEAGEVPNAGETSIMRSCNLLTSTGAIGYVGEKTLSVILAQLGKAYPENAAPFVVVTILRMFDPSPIQHCFESFRYRFEQVPGVLLRQRHFADENEQAQTIEVIRKRGLDPDGLESEGTLYADLYVGASPSDFEDLFNRLSKVDSDKKKN
jgi:hypothetical protein